MNYTWPQKNDRVRDKFTKEEGLVIESPSWDADVLVLFDGTDVALPVDRSLLEEVGD